MSDADSPLQTSDGVGLDTLTEKLLSAADAAKLHRRLTGRSVSIRTIYRWMSKGRSGVLLQHVKMAGEKYTSAEALNRFFNRSAEVNMQPPQAGTRPKKKPTKTTALSMRQRQIERARQNLIARGIITGEAV